MVIVPKNQMKTDALPGRGIQRAVGKDSASLSDSMTVGYASYSEEYGIMEPHCHAEETVIIFDAKDGSVCWGPEKDNLTHSRKLERGMVLHIPENEWHAFYYEPGGFVDIVFIYGTSENVRPEDNKQR
ncbi:MAG: hypothetical protein AB7C97_10190 [Oscillospiraceae bacterium]